MFYYKCCTFNLFIMTVTHYQNKTLYNIVFFGFKFQQSNKANYVVCYYTSLHAVHYFGIFWAVGYSFIHSRLHLDFDWLNEEVWVYVIQSSLIRCTVYIIVGSLMNLAKHPASTVQILGAEKALFRALKTKHDTPKYGLIYHASLVGQANTKIKGKVRTVY